MHIVSVDRDDKTGDLAEIPQHEQRASSRTMKFNLLCCRRYPEVRDRRPSAGYRRERVGVDGVRVYSAEDS